MRRVILVVTGFLAIVTAATLAVAQQQAADSEAEAAEEATAQETTTEVEGTLSTLSEDEALIARGKYIAHDVAMCVICHTPKDEYGLPIMGEEFEGGVIPARPTYPKMQRWAERAPALGSLAGGHPEDMIHFLQTGNWLTNRPKPRPPMPPFRLSEEDARAVVAYLTNMH